MRVCLTNPCWRDNGRVGIRAGCRVPNMVGEGEHTFMPFPFSLAYAMSVLEELGVEAMILDAIAEEIDEREYYDRVAAFEPDLIVNEMATASYHVDLAAATKLKQLTSARIAVCGPHASALPEEVLENGCIDFVLRGEIEQTLGELVAALREDRPLDEIAGLALRHPDGSVVCGTRREPIEDLDRLPHPHRSTLPLARYRVAGYPPPVLYMYASRGCPYKCTYCLWPQTMYGSGSYRVREPRAVVDEIEQAQDRHGPFASVYFDDDTFNLGKRRMLELARELTARSWKIPWGCNARADQFDEESLGRLAEAGLFNIRIGIESGDPRILERSKKQLDLAAIPRCIDLAHRAGVKVHVTFTVGLSGESWDSVERTVRFARSIRPDSVAFTITTPFPGTEYYDEVVRKGYMTASDWCEFNVVTSSVCRTASMTAEEVARAEKYLMRKVCYSPSYLARRLRYITSGKELLALVRKGAKVLFRRW
jgi:radical SAM superfamily enzyme YgiQ (UPF0313 family)